MRRSISLRILKRTLSLRNLKRTINEDPNKDPITENLKGDSFTEDPEKNIYHRRPLEAPGFSMTFALQKTLFGFLVLVLSDDRVDDGKKFS